MKIKTMENTQTTNTEIIHESTLYAEPIFHAGHFTFTNALLTSFGAVLIIAIIAVTIRLKLKTVPKGLQNVFEVLVDGALDLCDQVTGDRAKSMKIFPISFAVFLFVLVNNWMGILPGVGSIGRVVLENGEKIFVPYLRGGTADINTTLALGLLSVFGANIFGIISIGIWKTFNKFINLKVLSHMVTKVRKDPTILIVAPVTFFVGLIELLGEFAKIASLSFRLFGNVFAGEVLLASMSAIFPFILPIPFLFLEVVVGIIQALIFAMLTTVYYTIAATDHDHDEHDAHETEAGIPSLAEEVGEIEEEHLLTN